MDMSNIYNPIQPNSPYSVFTSGFNYSGTTPKNHYETIKVNGKNGAEKLEMDAYSSVLLLDQNDPLIWFVQTDGAGYKTCTPYTITPYQPPQEPDVQSMFTQLNNRLAQIEERMQKNESNNGTTQQPVVRTEFNI